MVRSWYILIRTRKRNRKAKKCGLANRKQQYNYDLPTLSSNDTRIALGNAINDEHMTLINNVQRSKATYEQAKSTYEQAQQELDEFVEYNSTKRDTWKDYHVYDTHVRSKYLIDGGRTRRRRRSSRRRR